MAADAQPPALPGDGVDLGHRDEVGPAQAEERLGRDHGQVGVPGEALAHPLGRLGRGGDQVGQLVALGELRRVAVLDQVAGQPPGDRQAALDRGLDLGEIVAQQVDGLAQARGVPPGGGLQPQGQRPVEGPGVQPPALGAGKARGVDGRDQGVERLSPVIEVLGGPQPVGDDVAGWRGRGTGGHQGGTAFPVDRKGRLWNGNATY